MVGTPAGSRDTYVTRTFRNAGPFMPESPPHEPATAAAATSDGRKARGGGARNQCRPRVLRRRIQFPGSRPDPPCPLPPLLSPSPRPAALPGGARPEVLVVVSGRASRTRAPRHPRASLQPPHREGVPRLDPPLRPLPRPAPPGGAGRARGRRPTSRTSRPRAHVSAVAPRTRPSARSSSSIATCSAASSPASTTRRAPSARCACPLVLAREEVHAVLRQPARRAVADVLADVRQRPAPARVLPPARQGRRLRPRRDRRARRQGPQGPR